MNFITETLSEAIVYINQVSWLSSKFRSVTNKSHFKYDIFSYKSFYVTFEGINLYLFPIHL